MTATNYKLEKERERFTVTEHGKVVSKGFLNEMDALHSIWILNGEIPHHFYIEKDFDVYLTERNEDGSPEKI
jgi:hypothetical protein